MVADITYTTTIVAMSCGACGIPFGLSNELYTRAMNHGASWYCPGCGQSRIFKTTENDRLKQELELEKRRRASAEYEAESTKRRLSAQRGLVTRMGNRAAAGVCLHCNRTFKQLAAHMKSKHRSGAK